jgi:YfiH family protein
MLELERHSSGLVGLRSPRLRALGVPHLFSTRVGPDGDLCLRSPDEGLRRLVRDVVGVPRSAPWCAVRQVHGAAVWDADRGEAGLDEGHDALVSAGVGPLLMVRTADCVPVLLAADEGRRVAAVHAGWRGLLAGVLPAAAAALAGRATAAAIGPCLSLPRCEMGPEVSKRFVDAGFAAAVHPMPGGRAHVDLRAVAAAQLTEAGYSELDVHRGCTWEEVEWFHSHRRDVTHGSLERAGSLAAFISARS